MERVKVKVSACQAWPMQTVCMSIGCASSVHALESPSVPQSLSAIPSCVIYQDGEILISYGSVGKVRDTKSNTVRHSECDLLY